MLFRANIVTLPLLWLLRLSSGQDFALLGNIENGLLLLDEDAKIAVYSTCFSGMALVTCTNDEEYNPNNLHYYQYFNDNYGIAYCLQCCGTNDGLDKWVLTCPMDGTASGTVNVYGREFRFARNRSPLDKEIVRCPIKRSACIYDEETGNVVVCNNLYDRTYLHGYTLDVEVVEYEDGFTYWRGVESCEVHSIIENNISYVQNNVFEENINLYYSRAPYSPTIFHGLVFLALLVLLLYAALYFFRKAHCLICGKKLVFFIDRCMMCRCYGAELPDPTLIKALGEKGVMMNDPSDGDVCCCDCRRCTARGQLYHAHKKKISKLNKVVAVNVQSMDERPEVPKSSAAKVVYHNPAARSGEIAEMKVEEELIYKAVGHPMYAQTIPMKYGYGKAYKPVDPRQVLPPSLAKKKTAAKK